MPINEHNQLYIYLDASVFISNKFDTNHHELIRLNKLCSKNNIKHIYTDITKKEVIKHLNKTIEEFSIKINLPTRYLESIRRNLVANFHKDFIAIKDEYWLDKLEIKYDQIKISSIMNKHFNEIAPFSKKKSNEFKDSIILNAILEFVEDRCGQALIVSKDKDWEKFSLLHKDSIKHFDSISKLVAYIEDTVTIYEKIETFYYGISSDLCDYLDRLYDETYKDYELYMQSAEAEDIIIEIYKKREKYYEFFITFDLYERYEVLHEKGMYTNYHKEHVVVIYGAVQDTKIIKCDLEGSTLFNDSDKLENLTKEFFKNLIIEHQEY